jgi:alanyl-tRNA synthetase
MEDLRRLADLLRERLGSGAALLGAKGNGKVLLLALLTPDLVARGMHAGRLAQEMARVAGGGGGGRPEMAQAGGRFPEKLKEALERGFSLLKEEMTAG